VRAESFDAAERRALAAALAAGQPLRCPACNAEVVARPVETPRAVAYVRRRVLVICPGCRRSGAIDR
jgi:uncharacterized protein with PIN domain